MDERTVFERALDLAEPGERAAFLDEACGQDAGLRSRVEALLRSHEQAGSFLAAPAESPVTIDQPITEKPGTVIGRYKLLEQIGEGGFGVVFMAEQEEPVRDIKPSNLMVTLRDDRPIPKVIDFGVAKATNARLTEQTLFMRLTSSRQSQNSVLVRAEREL